MKTLIIVLTVFFALGTVASAQTTTLEKDIKVFYVTATSFPQGIGEAAQKLHSLFPFSAERKTRAGGAINLGWRCGVCAGDCVVERVLALESEC